MRYAFPGEPLRVPALNDAQRASVTSKLVGLAERLEALGATLQRGSSGSGSGSGSGSSRGDSSTSSSGSHRVSPALLLQLQAAWHAVSLVQALAGALGNPAALRPHLGALVATLLQAGNTALAAGLHASQQTLVLGPLSEQVYKQATMLEFCLEDCERQGLRLDSSPEHTAAVLPWLATAAAALQQDAEGPSLDCLQRFGVLCSKLLAGLTFPHWHASLVSPQQQDAVLSLLLDAALPAVSAALEDGSSTAKQHQTARSTLTHVPESLVALSSGLQHRLARPGSAQAALESAARIAALPGPLPTATARSQLEAHTAAMRLVAVLSRSTLGLPPAGKADPAAAAALAAPCAGPEDCEAAYWAVLQCFPSLAASLRVVAQLGGQHLACGACLNLASALLLFRGAAGSPAAGAGNLMHSPQQAVYWARAARSGLRLLPLLARLRVQEVRHAEQQGEAGVAALVSAEAAAVRVAAELWQTEDTSETAEEQRAAAASEDALPSSSPVLLASHIICQLFYSGAHGAHAWVARMFASGASSRSVIGASSTGGTAASPAAAAALRPLCRLHMYGCRALHWLLANQAELPHDALLAIALDGLHSLLAAICDLAGCIDEEADGSSPLQLQGVCLGHWTAVQAAADCLQQGSGSSSLAGQGDAAALLSCNAAVSSTPQSGEVLCDALMRVAVLCPQLAGPRLLGIIRDVCTRPELASFSNRCFDAVVSLAQHAINQPSLAAALAEAGLLDLVAAAGERRASEGTVQGMAWAANLLDTLSDVVDGLATAAEDAAGRLGSSCADEEQGLQAQLQDQLACFRAAQEQCADAREAAASDLAGQAKCFKQLLQPAAQLAATLQTVQQQPEQQMAAAVQLARAAATWGCSYLRCAELEAEGKSKVCTACRTGRYCCRACSVADWRHGGHKRVCAVLAAERQQQEGAGGQQGE